MKQTIIIRDEIILFFKIYQKQRIKFLLGATSLRAS